MSEAMNTELASLQRLALAIERGEAAASAVGEIAQRLAGLAKLMPRAGLRYTRTYVELGLSQPAYDEIKQRLQDAGYDHAFMADGAIDLHGLAAQLDPAAEARGVVAFDAVVPAPAVRFPETSCSQCGGTFGPGNAGYSQCSDHQQQDGRTAFEEAVFNRRFRASVQRNPSPPKGFGGLDFISVGCPTKDQLCERSAKGDYVDETVSAMWWGWQEALTRSSNADAWVAQVVSSGPLAELPLLQWRSAEVSLCTPIGAKLYTALQPTAPDAARQIADATDAARYRWLRDGRRYRQGEVLPTGGARQINRDQLRVLMMFQFGCSPEELNAAIDRERNAGVKEVPDAN